ncbi:hypothetical protein CYMTET_51819 [Cymbomonas tetramitiformis]|uniref:Uncharacterized protein n=1 Tax=Cymbomonas tetramitiformis TaxID=36881 RepID=A0AAE0BLG2_9CHLO|nr:hypothetical protein CYMTET_51819 [Cymbomonas tetramitiformis]
MAPLDLKELYENAWHKKPVQEEVPERTMPEQFEVISDGRNVLSKDLPRKPPQEIVRKCVEKARDVESVEFWYTVAECRKQRRTTWELNFLNAHSRGRWRRPYLKRRMSPERPTTNISETFGKKRQRRQPLHRQDEKELLREARKPTKLCPLEHKHRQHEGHTQFPGVSMDEDDEDDEDDPDDDIPLAYGD